MADKKQYDREFNYNIGEGVFLNPKLNITDVRLYGIIKSFEDTRKRNICPSNRWLAIQTHTSPATIKRSLFKLEEMKLVERTEIKHKRYLKTVYFGPEVEEDNETLDDTQLNNEPPPGSNVSHPQLNNELHTNTTCTVSTSTKTLRNVSSVNKTEAHKIQALVIEKLKDDSFKLSQAKQLLKAHHKDSHKTQLEHIGWSLDNYLKHLTSPQGDNIGSPIGCFMFHVLKYGFFLDADGVVTQDKPEEDSKAAEFAARSAPNHPSHRTTTFV